MSTSIPDDEGIDYTDIEDRCVTYVTYYEGSDGDCGPDIM
jgi:hypothetical protein